jgi:hypothetical protein
MEPGTVNPRGARFTDQELREDLGSGLKPADIARKYQVSPAAVSKRITKLNLATTTAAVAPEESRRFVSGQINAIEQLERGLGRVNLLMDACDAWLRSADDPERYDVGARAEEVDVTYEVEVRTANGSLVTQKRTKRLTELMGCLEGEDEDGARFCGWKHGETKRADPRELILRTVAEGRQTVAAATELAKLLADMRAMQEWREVVLGAIGRAAPDVRDEIIAEVRSSLVLRGLLDGPAGSGQVH